MKFSIVVPVYNVQDYLEICIDELICQAEKLQDESEIILVDDGSLDESGKICDKYKYSHPELIRVIHKKNGGLLSARRAGFKAAQGEYIINCDSDDLMLPDALRSISESLLFTNADVLFFNADMILPDGRREVWYKNIFTNKDISIIEKKQVWDSYFEGYSTVSMWCKVFHKKCIDVDDDYHRFGRMNAGEDSLQSIEIYLRADSFAYLNKSLYGYRMSSGMTSNYDSQYYQQFKNVLNEILANEHKIEVDNFNVKFSGKLFDIVGRTITQGRSERKLGIRQEKQCMSDLRNDELVCRFEEYYYDTKGTIKKSHRVVCDLLLKKRYTLLFVMLQMKNLSDRSLLHFRLLRG